MPIVTTSPDQNQPVLAVRTSRAYASEVDRGVRMSSTAGRANGERFHHEAFFYASEDEYFDGKTTGL